MLNLLTLSFAFINVHYSIWKLVTLSSFNTHVLKSNTHILIKKGIFAYQQSPGYMGKGSLISFMSNLVKEQGGINLAQGIPGFNPPPELICKLKELTDQNLHQYAAGNGNKTLLELLAAHYSSYRQFTSEDFLVTQGATEAIALVFIYLAQLLGNKLKVLAFEPAYESYRQLPAIFQKQFTLCPLMNNNSSIDFEKLEGIIARKKISLVFVCTPGNPLGRVFSKEEMQNIITLSDRYGFFVVIDAVYKDLYFHDPPYLPLGYTSDKLFYVNSFSKMLSITGWRIGYLSATNHHLGKIKSIHDYIGLCAPTLQQQALVEYLAENEFGERYTSTLRKNIFNSYQLMHKALLKLHFVIPEIDGGYFTWAQLPESYRDGYQFSIDLFDKTKVAVVPGIHFSKDCSDFIRLNFAVQYSTITEAARRINNYVSSLSGRNNSCSNFK